MIVTTSPIVIELEPQDLEALGWKRAPASCACGHQEAWMVPLGDGAFMSYGCTTCRRFYLLNKDARLDEYKQHVREETQIRDIERQYVGRTVDDQEIEGFLRECDLDRE